MGKFALYTIGFALLACVPAILLAGMFSGGGGDVAPFLLVLRERGEALALEHDVRRSEERRVVKECLRLCRSRWSPYQ